MLPAYTDPIWRMIVLDDTQYDFKFFALRILMGRIKMRLEFEEDDDVVVRCIDELYAFAQQYPELVEADLNRVRKKERGR